MSAPVPIKIIKPAGQEIEIAGVRYDQPYPAKHHCHWCVAVHTIALCDLLCPYCREQMVFAKKTEKR